MLLDLGYSIIAPDQELTNSHTHFTHRTAEADQASSSRSTGIVYDQAYLSQLKASTPSTRPPRPMDEGQYDEEVAMAIEAGAVVENLGDAIPAFCASLQLF